MLNTPLILSFPSDHPIIPEDYTYIITMSYSHASSTFVELQHQ